VFLDRNDRVVLEIRPIGLAVDDSVRVSLSVVRSSIASDRQNRHPRFKRGHGRVDQHGGGRSLHRDCDGRCASGAEEGPEGL
jgi:hypothetical protein